MNHYLESSSDHHNDEVTVNGIWIRIAFHQTPLNFASSEQADRVSSEEARLEVTLFNTEYNFCLGTAKFTTHILKNYLWRLKSNVESSLTNTNLTHSKILSQNTFKTQRQPLPPVPHHRKGPPQQPLSINTFLKNCKQYKTSPVKWWLDP
jgi:hypothetical protein